ncbi:MULTISPECIES: outer membrane lipoprotein chaperone LolA [Alteromonadaceae]|uniref:outer membrane lipoprotein chaperone LolA n=1 Tax=Alteromonadaceae TaxID=72275 RepID=UPI002091CF12|nr:MULTISPECIES: outer membrane lipoprotein chaperone LolA [Aliiglaciecola]MDO6712722.1 outer membrane lipoprotein chaperone LolA [Aliiglaciecola sp. 2_MG-2023]MDO6753879.1 outer membrane lipoprotein chaperone LolA [Aliiglaciecola sp. 1_MG-2023]
MRSKLIKSYCVFVGILMLSSISVAHGNQGDSPDASENLKQKLLSLKTFTAAFEQKVTDGQGELVQESSGQMTLKQPNLMIWQVNSPDENLMVADGTTLWYSDPFVEQVTAINQADSVSNNPIVLLTNPSNEQWSEFTITYADNDVYSIIAISPESQISELKLKFENNQLSQLSFIDRQQQTSQLTFSDVKQNINIGDEQFVFTIPDGFDLDDQR